MAPGQLPCGGGEAVVHSSPLASHGLSAAFLPLNALQKKFAKKTSWAAPRMKALMVMNWLMPCSGLRNSYW
jgi:hypothetical protein